MKRHSFIARFVAVVFSAAAMLVVASPAAQAQRVFVSTEFTSPVVGIDWQSGGYSGSETLFINSTVVARTSVDKIGQTQFGRTGTHCGCTVKWRNLDTGVSGAWTMPAVGMIDAWEPTGSGRIEASARIDGTFGFTVITGRGSWVVP